MNKYNEDGSVYYGSTALLKENYFLMTMVNLFAASLLETNDESVEVQ